MDSDEKCSLLADEIRKILGRGIILGSDVVHYIDSTFSNPTISEIQSILHDDSNCEKDSLMELLFFPDEAIQLELEEMLEYLRFDRQDEDQVLNALCRETLKVSMCWPGDRGSLDLILPREVAARFIERLHMSKHLDGKLREAIQKYTKEDAANSYKVKIRNSRFSPDEDTIQFLCDFFEKLPSQSRDFNLCFEFALSFLDEVNESRNLYQALMTKKRCYLSSVQKAKKLDTYLQKHNMETLLAQGKRVVMIDQADARKKMWIIDRISRAVFGKTKYFEPLHNGEEPIELDTDRDVQDIIRILS